MNAADSQGNSEGPRAGGFGDTEWQVVRAGGDSDTSIRRKAFGQLYDVYWYPIYAFIRRQGRNHHDAQDLAQGFFTELVERESLKDVAPQKGRFRSFLLAALKHFLANAHAYEKRQKRGGEYRFVSWEELPMQARYEAESQVNAAPDTQFDRDWARGVFERAREILRREYDDAGKTTLFRDLEGYLTPGGPLVPYSAVGAKLALSENAAKMSVVRLRQRFREILRRLVVSIASSPDDAEEELHYLFSTLND